MLGLLLSFAGARNLRFLLGYETRRVGLSCPQSMPLIAWDSWAVSWSAIGISRITVLGHKSGNDVNSAESLNVSTALALQTNLHCF